MDMPSLRHHELRHVEVAWGRLLELVWRCLGPETGRSEAVFMGFQWVFNRFQGSQGRPQVLHALRREPERGGGTASATGGCRGAGAELEVGTWDVDRGN